MSTRRAGSGDALVAAFITALITVLSVFAALSAVFVVVDSVVTGS